MRIPLDVKVGVAYSKSGSTTLFSLFRRFARKTNTLFLRSRGGLENLDSGRNSAVEVEREREMVWKYALSIHPSLFFLSPRRGFSIFYREHILPPRR